MSDQRKLMLRDFEQIKGCEIPSLKSIAENNAQMKFLDVLSRSKDFIVWLKKETKGM